MKKLITLLIFIPMFLSAQTTRNVPGAYATIQSAINAAVSGDIINVAAGTYTEDLTIPVGKTGLEIVGAGSGSTIIQGVDRVLSTSFPLADPNIDISGNGTKIHGFTIQNPSWLNNYYSSGMVIGATNVEIYNNAFKVAGSDDLNDVSQGLQTVFNVDISGLNIHNNTFTHLAASVAGYEGIYVNKNSGVGTITITNNTFSGEILRAITTEASSTTISNNSIITSLAPGFPGGWQGINVTYANGLGTVSTISVTGNTVKGTGSGGFQYGVSVGAAANNNILTAISITNNTIQGNERGIRVREDAGQVTATSNNLSTNTVYGIDNTDAGTMTATNNWWGSASGPSGVGPGTGTAVTANVTYDPWFGKNVSPGLYAVGVSVIPNFAFTGSVISKNLQISTNTGFTALVLNKTISGTSYTFSSGDLINALAGGYQLSNNTTYYWRIYDTGTSSLLEPLNPPPPFENYYTFKTVTSSGLNLTTPTNASTISGGTIGFSWYTTAYGMLFDLQRDDGAGGAFTTIVSGTSDYYYSYDGSGLTPGATYRWRVISKTPAGVVTNYSAIRTFTMSGLPTPIPSYPIGNATVYVTSPTLYWYLGTYNTSVTSYNIKYWRNVGSSDPGYPPAVAQSNLQGSFNTGASDTYSALTASLDPGYTYSWQVQSSNGAQTSAWSSVKTFTVYSSTPASAPVPYPSWPVGGATSYINPPTLYWYLGTYATGLYFYVEWSSDGFATVAGNSGWFADNLYYALPTALASGTYSWHVKSRIGLAGSISAYSSTATFVIPTSASSSATVPVVTYPTGGATVYVLNPTLGWYAYSTSTLEFQVRISTTSSVDGDGMLSNPLAVSSTSWTTATSLDVASIPYTLTAGAPYYWQVRSRLVSTPSVVSAWSFVASFATAASSSAVVPLAGTPNFGQPINNTTAVLNWSLPVKSNSYLNYDVEYSKNSDFSNSTVVKDIPEKVTSLNGLDKNSTYYWRVLSKNTQGTSNYSQAASFQTGTVTEVKEAEIIPSEFELSQNYPNPFNPTTVIKFSIPNSQFVTLKVYDMLGREIRTLLNAEKTAGTYSIDWNAEDNLGLKVASGMYIYRITAGNFVATKKMVLIK